MNKKAILAFLVLALTVIATISSVSAAGNGTYVRINSMDPEKYNVSVEAGKSIPVALYYVADKNLTRVTVSTWIRGENSDSDTVEVAYGDFISGSTYRIGLNLKMPTNIDPTETLVLIVRVEGDEGSWQESYRVYAQRVTDNLDILLVDMDSPVKAGANVPITIVLKNRGLHESEDTMVNVEIPGLGISKTVYLNDITPTDDCSDCDKLDSAKGIVYVTIPSNANVGNYDITVKAYNDYTKQVVKKTIKVVSATVTSGQVIPSPTSRTFNLGQEAVYDLILVNTGSNIAIYNVAATQSDALTVTVSDPVAVVPAGSSKVVKVYVKASREGTHTFSVTAISGNKVQTAAYTATVEGKSGRSISTGFTGSNNVVVLTIALAIIFVVLVVVLIVLLTRKPEKSEEFGESYY